MPACLLSACPWVAWLTSPSVMSASRVGCNACRNSFSSFHVSPPARRWNKQQARGKDNRSGTRPCNDTEPASRAHQCAGNAASRAHQCAGNAASRAHHCARNEAVAGHSSENRYVPRRAVLGRPGQTQPSRASGAASLVALQQSSSFVQ